MPTPEMQAFASGFPIALLHIAVSVLMLLAAAAIYIVLTPHKEVSLVRDGNVAAAVDLGGALVGLAIPLAFSLKGSTSLFDVALWGVATVAIQLLVYRLVDLVLHDLPKRIQDGEVAAAAVLVGAKLATAMIVAASVAT